MVLNWMSWCLDWTEKLSIFCKTFSQSLSSVCIFSSCSRGVFVPYTEGSVPLSLHFFSPIKLFNQIELMKIIDRFRLQLLHHWRVNGIGLSVWSPTASLCFQWNLYYSHFMSLFRNKEEHWHCNTLSLSISRPYTTSWTCILVSGEVSCPVLCSLSLIRL